MLGRRWGGRVALSVAVALGLVGLTAGPALAHTEVTVKPARAAALNAVATVHAEAESDSAGIRSVRVFLPEGVTPADVTLVKAPAGWNLTRQADSYTVAGKALAVGRAAEHRVRIRQLPNARTIYFKVLQTYSDGRVDRWIEIPSDANPKPDNPAAGVKLAAAPAAATTPAAPATSAPATPTPTTAPAAQPSVSVAAGEPDGDDSGGVALWWIAAAAVVVLGGAGWLGLRRRRST